MEPQEAGLDERCFGTTHHGRQPARDFLWLRRSILKGADIPGPRAQEINGHEVKKKPFRSRYLVPLEC